MSERCEHEAFEVQMLGHVTSTTERCTLCGHTERDHWMDERGMGCPEIEGNRRYTTPHPPPTPRR